MWKWKKETTWFSSFHSYSSPPDIPSSSSRFFFGLLFVVGEQSCREPIFVLGDVNITQLGLNEADKPLGLIQEWGGCSGDFHTGRFGSCLDFVENILEVKGVQPLPRFVTDEKILHVLRLENAVVKKRGGPGFWERTETGGDCLQVGNLPILGSPNVSPRFRNRKR